MTLIAPTLQAWFTDRLMTQKNASPRTIAAYRDTLRLLLAFAQQQVRKEPCQLDFADLDAPLIGAFLNHLEQRPWQQPQDPQRKARSDPLALPILRAAPSRTRRHDRPRDRDPDQTPPANDDLLPRPGRDRRACSKRPTGPRGSDDATTRCSSQRSRPACASQNSSTSRSPACRSALERTYECWARVARSVARCSPVRPSTVLEPWLRERNGGPHDPLFPTRRGGPLTPERSRCCSISTPPPPCRRARRFRPSASPRTPCGTPTRCCSEPRRSTSTRSRCGSGMRAPNQPRSTSTPTTRSNSKRSTGPPRPAPHPAATSHPTNSSRSSNVCSYRTSPLSPPLRAFAATGRMPKASRGGARAAPTRLPHRRRPSRSGLRPAPAARP